MDLFLLISEGAFLSNLLYSFNFHDFLKVNRKEKKYVKKAGAHKMYYVRMLLQKGFNSIVSQTMVTKMGNSFFSSIFKFIVDSFLFYLLNCCGHWLASSARQVPMGFFTGFFMICIDAMERSPTALDSGLADLSQNWLGLQRYLCL